MSRELSAKGQATRQRLLDAAVEYLAADGTVEVAKIAEAAGVSPSVIYRYFDGRDGLVAAVVDGFYDDYQERVFDRRDVPGTTWRVREAVRLELEIAFFYDHPLGRAVAGGLLREPAAAQVDAGRTRAHSETAARNIRSGQRSGELAPSIDAGLAGAAIIGAVRAMIGEALVRTPPADQRAVVTAALSVGAAMLGVGELAPTPTTRGPRR
ncbi:TetR/AcrR family transcriptional regulator [Rhodococcus erythropolis]|uniref:TetR/AcrR family transcriptional regulator n=1 Tax=Rhodococcus erythropolis TaxID=1833 RepID=UPI002109D362|nr:TetR/AcrR family transcriptional regulator [Rhodococcus erythropolis]MCQ4125243.1 TetR/AcrR family transcriptional regulator [Rhodococcus erythropolis]